MSEHFVIVNIVRDDGSISRYSVEFEYHLTVARILDLIYRGQDRTVAYRHFCCKTGECMSCLVKVNGTNVQACKYVVEPGAELRLEAVNKDRAIRDLAMNFGSQGASAIPVKIMEFDPH